MYGSENKYGAPLSANVRAGDAEREATVERLRKHHTDGRIDVTEFQERLDRAYDSKTVGELRELVSDLPGDQAHASTLGWRSRPRAHGLFPWVAILLVIVSLSLIPGYHHHPGPGPWMLIPLFFFVRFFVWGRRPWGRRQREITEV